VKDEFAIACQIDTPIGRVYVAPNGCAMATWRIGEFSKGVCTATPDLSNAEIDRAGLAGRVSPCINQEAERLYP
jgi:hypothetical protein